MGKAVDPIMVSEGSQALKLREQSPAVLVGRKKVRTQMQADGADER
jgi:hypothetical protein